jgi:hypothetical protein
VPAEVVCGHGGPQGQLEPAGGKYEGRHPLLAVDQLTLHSAGPI